MSAKILDGAALSRIILDELKEEVAAMRAARGTVPGLATILVGEDPASVSYVTRKVATAHALGFHEVQETLPASAREEDVLALIRRHNADPRIHGILVQLPLPRHMEERSIIHAIAPEKDVDGFHPVNLGKLLMGDATAFLPCTPAGIREMLMRADVELDGAEVVVVGRSNIVGKPLAVLLGQKGPGGNATVTLTHTGTRDLAAHCRRADVLVAAAGVPGLVKAEWIRPGAVVIDVGVNRVGFNEKTGKPILSGDVDFAAASEVAGMITPVPGGVGPMTIAMLMKNTVRSARQHPTA
ncbi:tetrahydrofolate dehydrogenase/cyclohydrolase catalytic domain-containing protein [uncultured Desulfovibrio sp.]|uniref:bifunctional 5,10-methylenetetrahydrofolate dehydrogenase/5,10-methenyltetrahydrofolate cyclohydrolase n=1 Tax=uncultured Desulfovibrio sp. TaxID=167968 RepID=UPI002805C09C|nr:tetrahydrofolate dehydrogenase/cyclohydrolase catalytic domain-containing protein [uncultured Desulfovibrio sp.]